MAVASDHITREPGSWLQILRNRLILITLLRVTIPDGILGVFNELEPGTGPKSQSITGVMNTTHPSSVLKCSHFINDVVVETHHKIVG